MSGVLPLPQDAKRILEHIGKKNPHLQISQQWIDDNVSFIGEDLPLQPGPLKSAACVSAFQAVFGSVADQIAQIRYGGEHNKVTINTEHAGLFLAVVALFKASGKVGGDAADLAPLWDDDWYAKPMCKWCTCIYPTKDNRWFFLSGSLDSRPLLKHMGLDEDDTEGNKGKEQARKIIGGWVKQFTAQELEEDMTRNKFCGSICYEPEEWLKTQMGAALDKMPIFDTRPLAPSPPCPFPSNPSFTRPLEGIKVVALTRIIAGQVIGRQLAELGATVIKVNPPHLRDISIFQFTLTAGCQTTALDARKPADRAALDKLIGECDVFINGYRGGAIDRLGYGKQAVLDIIKKARGTDASVVYVDENTYGTEGPYRERPGWQQIADSASGACMVMGRGIGKNEAVLPPLPISDICTGVITAASILSALRDRATKGGSYHVVGALTKYDMFCVSKFVGSYPEEIMKQVSDKFNFPAMDHTNDVLGLLAGIAPRWLAVLKEKLDFETSPYFCKFEDTHYGPLRILAPVAQLDKTPSKWVTPPQPYGNGPPTFT